jgi:putative transposase
MGAVEKYTRNVKRWRGGAMILRWVSAAVRHAQRGFRRIRGHKELASFLRALTQSKPMDSEQAAA